ncbi:sugar ABC transporter substrate-binding protein [Planctomyces sp. SH-PL62]|uniref:sugar ABC transporter substrate-binding protein n=1 Tax=Planctomyces sp. SH-PL62 TaxID=1636152 RepID=UPI00078E329E|nr:substrate-binding domain-containing protein [Planctomyces sp. SH-PL62]AMV40611.1 hypothetical protein VT85_24485 [Planctomyces sp. SH-PL62]
MTRFGFAGTGLRGRLVGLVGAAFWLVASGCEGPKPPSASGLGRSTVVASGKGVRTLELVPSPKPAADMDYVRNAARIQAGLDTSRIQVADASVGVQADLVRQAILREPPALIIEAPAEPDAELNRAAGEARAKGIPVVALGRSLGESAGGPGREIVVAPKPFRESADRIVELAMRNAGNGKVDPKAGAAILAETPSDPTIGERLVALKEALAAAGVAEVGEVRFARDLEAARAVLLDYLKAHPKTTLVLGADGFGVDVAEDVAGDAAKDGRPYVVAGYSADESNAKSQTQVGEFAAIGVYSSDRLVRKGVNVAAKLVRGETIGDRVEMETPVLPSPISSGLAKGRPEPVAKAADPDE